MHSRFENQPRPLGRAVAKDYFGTKDVGGSHFRGSGISTKGAKAV